MKKFLKRFLLFFCLPVALFIGFIFGSTFYIRKCMPEHFDYKDSTAHFNISYNESDKEAIADIKDRLESNYDRITTDLNQKMDEPVNIKIYSDLNSYHFNKKIRSGLFWWIEVFKKYSPQVVGDTDPGTGVISMVSPLNPGESGYTYDIILSVAVHEFTHAVAVKVMPKPEYTLFTGFGMTLNEGLAVYESDQGSLFDKDDSFNASVLKVLPKSIDDLTVDNDYRYPIGYSFVKYVVENYGYNKIIELLQKDHKESNKSKYDSETRALYDSWVEYLKSN